MQIVTISSHYYQSIENVCYNCSCPMAERFESTDPALYASDTRTQIEEGIITDPRILNGYLSAMIAWERGNAAKESGVYKEAHGELILRYIKALNGSYQKEKPQFCLAQAQDHLSRASLKDTAESPSESTIPEQERRQSLRLNRKYAANWLRMAALV